MAGERNIFHLREVIKMSWKTLFGKATWVGLALAVAVLLLGILAGSLLVVRRIIPAEGMALWTAGSCCLAAAVGGCIAGKGGRGLQAFLVAILLYVAMWLVALSISEPLDFSANGPKMTCAVIGGGFISCLLCRGGKRKRKSGKTSTVRHHRRRMV